MKWDKVDIALQHHCTRTLEGVRQLRQEWNEMFAQRLNPKRYKFSEDDEKLIETISMLLTNEGKFYRLNRFYVLWRNKQTKNYRNLFR